MGLIHVLKPHIANQIAAGEVVERPSSVVKELVENAIDARSTAITVEIESGGMHLIRVTDNGCGIAKEDCRNAFLRHATSKISSTEDLERLNTLGFRGEALASIASVARVTMTTRVADAPTGTRITLENGAVLSEEDAACVYGTSFTVEALFASVPARLKFLKSTRTEAGYIGDYMARMILARPDIAFRYLSDHKVIYETYGDGELYNALYCVYGKTIAEKVLPVRFENGYLRIEGYLGLPEISRSNRTYQTLLLNGRYIRSFSIAASVLQAYDTRIMIGKFPFFVLNLSLAPQEFDVNVHPTKLEVRFADEQRVCGTVKLACKEALSGTEQHIESALETCAPAEPKATTFDVPRSDAPMHTGRSLLDSPAYLSAKEQYRMRETPALNSFSHIGQSGSVPVYRVSDSYADVPKKKVQEPSLLDVGEPFTIIGCAFSGYWMVTRGDNLYMIDQHAAHERKLYDQLASRAISIQSQPLLLPYETKLTPSEADALDQHRSDLEELGYTFEKRSALSVHVLSVPVLNGIQLREAYLHETLEIFSEHGKQAVDQMVRSRLMQSACKHAIKAGEPMTREEIEGLLSEYLNGERLLTCPHGRPVIIRITKTELEKMFRRIV